MLDTTPTTPSTPEVAAEVPHERGLLARIAGRCARHWRWLLIGAVIVVVSAATVVAGARDRWSNGGFTATGTAAAEADRVAAAFGADSADLTLYVRAPRPVDGADVAEQGRRLTAMITQHAGVSGAYSYWTTGSPLLRSRDGLGAIVRIDLAGTERDTAATARTLVPAARKASDILDVSATGPAWLNAEATGESEHDLERGELLAAPLTLLILLLAFGSLTAAALPIAIGVISVAGALAALAALTHVMAISAFAINICASLGFALSVDYALFIVTRYREEIAQGVDSPRAIARSMATAGRAVLFSAATVAVCLSALFVFPLELLRSLAYASILIVAICALTTVLVLPALLAVLGPRLDRLDPFRRLRRGTGGKDGASPLWRRIATIATTRPLVCGAVATVLLLLMALPFTHARFHTIDEKILPAQSEPHRTANLLRADFVDPPDRIIPVILPDTHAVADAPALEAYALRLSQLPHVVHVVTDTGDYRAGLPVPSPPRPPGTETAVLAGPGTVVRVVGSADSQAAETVALVHELRTIPAPHRHLVAGKAAELTDTKDAVRDALPYGLGIVLAGTLMMLFLFTRTVLVPIKAVAMGLLSLTATLGAIVFIFQDGHLRSLLGDFTTTGSLETTIPLLTLAIAFGISVDYEVFLISRIKEEYDRTGDNTHSIVFGIAHTGRLFTAAALIVAATMVALTLSDVVLLKMLGVGLAVAVVVDATVVRGVLVPALMQLTGRANWWAPKLRSPVRRKGTDPEAKLPDARGEADAATVGGNAAATPDAPEETVS